MELPNDILTEIMSRLPVSTLYKIFKDQSSLRNKELYDIISDENFPHLKLTIMFTHICNFLAYYNTKAFLIEYDLKTNKIYSTKLNMNFVRKTKAKLISTSITASCNGWLLISLLHERSNDGISYSKLSI